MMSDIKAQAKSSRNTKLHTLGGKGSVGKSYDTGAGHTFNGEAGLNSDHIQDEQRIKTRKDGGRVGGTKMKPRLDRKAKMNDHDEDDGYMRGGRVARAEGGKVDEPKRIPRSDQPKPTTTADDLIKEMGGKNKGGRVERASGGKVGGKGKTNITIVMAPGGQGGSQAPQAVPVPRPIPVPIQASPPGAAPPMGAGAPPMPMPPPAAGPMGRKKGGRVNKDKGGSTGSGVGNKPIQGDYTGYPAVKAWMARRNNEGTSGPYTEEISGKSPGDNTDHDITSDSGGKGRKKGGRVGRAYGGANRTPDQNNHSDLPTRHDGSTPRSKANGSTPQDSDADGDEMRRGGRAKKASGGKVTVGKGLGLTAGAGGGEGRLEKIKVQKRTYP